ncbi:unnamed protein product [Pleuronectes platessa]|uniref:Uncharacterized protein n=1 Tax=Pleuronectes platessa TaxID=8262 RepID=A0A9N7V465_PLEPL|nr:unnamed protein product [Pleuronectes platessa]
MESQHCVPFLESVKETICLVAVSEPPVEAISSKLSNTASYCLRTEWTAATRTVHRVGHSGFRVLFSPALLLSLLQPLLLYLLQLSCSPPPASSPLSPPASPVSSSSLSS